MRTLLLLLVLVPLLPAAARAELHACCHPVTHECDLMTEEECEAIDGIWFPGLDTCEPNP